MVFHIHARILPDFVHADYLYFLKEQRDCTRCCAWWRADYILYPHVLLAYKLKTVKPQSVTVFQCPKWTCCFDCSQFHHSFTVQHVPLTVHWLLLRFSDPSALIMVHHAAIADAQEQSHKSQLDMAAHSLCVALGTAKRGRLLELEPLLELSSDYAESLLKIQRWLDAFHAAAEAVNMKPDFVKVDKSSAFFSCSAFCFFVLCPDITVLVDWA